MIGTSACSGHLRHPLERPHRLLWRWAYVDGELVLNPNQRAAARSPDWTSPWPPPSKKVVMIEAGANEVPDDIMYEAIVTAHEENQKAGGLHQRASSAEIGKPKFDYPHADFNQELFDKIVARLSWTRPRPPWTPTTRTSGRPAGTRMIEHWHEKYLEEYPDMDQVSGGVHLQVPEEDRQGLAAGGPPCGRPRRRTRSVPWPPRWACCPVSTAPACSPAARPRCSPCATLDTLSACQKLDTIWEETEKRYMHHYNFPGLLRGRGQARPQPRPPRDRPRRSGGAGPAACDPLRWRSSPMPSAWSPRCCPPTAPPPRAPSAAPPWL